MGRRLSRLGAGALQVGGSIDGDRGAVGDGGPDDHAHLEGAELPNVTWRNTDQPQNGCLGAPLDFAYSGLARR